MAEAPPVEGSRVLGSAIEVSGSGGEAIGSADAGTCTRGKSCGRDECCGRGESCGSREAWARCGASAHEADTASLTCSSMCSSFMLKLQSSPEAPSAASGLRRLPGQGDQAGVRGHGWQTSVGPHLFFPLPIGKAPLKIERVREPVLSGLQGWKALWASRTAWVYLLRI